MAKSSKKYQESPFMKECIDKGMSVVVFPAGKTRVVNVAARLLMHNLDPQRKDDHDSHVPVVSVREQGAQDAKAVHTFRHVEFLGPARIEYRPDDPLPNTNGRGIATLITESALRCYSDEGTLTVPIEADLP